MRQADNLSRYAQQVEAALRALMSGQAFPLYEEIEDLIKQSVMYPIDRFRTLTLVDSALLVRPRSFSTLNTLRLHELDKSYGTPMS
jgi:hypothetical protein